VLHRSKWYFILDDYIGFHGIESTDRLPSTKKLQKCDFHNQKNPLLFSSYTLLLQLFSARTWFSTLYSSSLPPSFPKPVTHRFRHVTADTSSRAFGDGKSTQEAEPDQVEHTRAWTTDKTQPKQPSSRQALMRAATGRAPIPPQSSTRWHPVMTPPWFGGIFHNTLSTPTLNESWLLRWYNKPNRYLNKRNCVTNYVFQVCNSTCWFGSIRSVVSSSGNKTTKLLDKKNYKTYKNLTKTHTSHRQKWKHPCNRLDTLWRPFTSRGQCFTPWWPLAVYLSRAPAAFTKNSIIFTPRPSKKKHSLQKNPKKSISLLQNIICQVLILYCLALALTLTNVRNRDDTLTQELTAANPTRDMLGPRSTRWYARYLEKNSKILSASSSLSSMSFSSQTLVKTTTCVWTIFYQIRIPIFLVTASNAWTGKFNISCNRWSYQVWPWLALFRTYFQTNGLKTSDSTSIQPKIVHPTHQRHRPRVNGRSQFSPETKVSCIRFSHMQVHAPYFSTISTHFYMFSSFVPLISPPPSFRCIISIKNLIPFYLEFRRFFNTILIYFAHRAHSLSLNCNNFTVAIDSLVQWTREIY
jgi:hypothetical protein